MPNVGPCERRDYALGIKCVRAREARSWLFIAQRRYHREGDPTYPVVSAAAAVAAVAAASWKHPGSAGTAGIHRQ